MQDILTLTLRLGRVCDQLEIPYLVGGSLASSLHGIPRATQDVDLVVVMAASDIAGFIAALGADFYLDEDAIRDAVERRTSFNLVDLTSYFKADVFVAKNDEPARLQLARARRYEVGGGSVVVASAEDVVAQKLYWYALGDRASERQWRDAIGVLTVAGPALDFGYLQHIAGLLGVGALLQEAAAEARVSLGDS